MDIRLGVVRGITFGHLGPPDDVMAQVTGLNLGVFRTYIYWAQVEPEPGRYDWTAVDALLGQLDDDVEAWVTVSSASLWGTKRATDFLPPSPATDLDRFGAFVRALVAHCRGRIAYWQCDNEPSVPILWAGTPEEYVAQLRVFAQAVRDTDPAARVVLGGMPPGATENAARPVWEHIIGHAGADFDLLDIHLYGDPYGIPDAMAAAREMMAAAGYDKPIVAGEYNGPLPSEFPEQVFPHLGAAMAAMGGPPGGPIADDWATTTTDFATPPPEHAAMAEVYARGGELPAELRMFVPDAAPEDEDRRHRWNCRDIVVRNMFALAGGASRTLCWNLGPEAAGVAAPGYGLMALMFEKLKLMDYADGALTHRYPAAETLRLTAAMLRGATGVRRHAVPDRPDLYVFEIQRRDRPATLVAWVRRPGVNGEDAPPVPFDWAWEAPAATVIDAYGREHRPELSGGRVRIPLTVVPVFITADR